MPTIATQESPETGADAQTTSRVRLVTSMSGLLELRPEWERLRALGDPGNPFATFTWALAWTRNFLSEFDGLVCAVVDVPGRCRGIAPFVHRRRWMAGLRVRSLEALGADDVTYKGFLVEGDADSFVETLLRALLTGPHAWDLVVCDSLPGDSRWADRLVAGADRLRLRRERHVPSPAPFLPLPTTYEALRPGMSKNFRRSLSRRLNQMARMGISMERHTGSAVRTEHVRQARDVERSSWKGEQQVGIFGDERHLGLHLDLLADRDRPFDLDYAFLREAGVPVAFQYGFLQQDRYFAYNTSYDGRYRSISPGTLLIDGLIQELIPAGVRVFDFLVGDGEYKRSWTSQAKHNEGVTVFGRSLGGRAARLHQRARAAARAGRERLRARGPG